MWCLLVFCSYLSVFLPFSTCINSIWKSNRSEGLNFIVILKNRIISKTFCLDKLMRSFLPFICIFYSCSIFFSVSPLLCFSSAHTAFHMILFLKLCVSACSLFLCFALIFHFTNYPNVLCYEISDNCPIHAINDWFSISKTH